MEGIGAVSNFRLIVRSSEKWNHIQRHILHLKDKRGNKPMRKKAEFYQFIEDLKLEFDISVEEKNNLWHEMKYGDNRMKFGFLFFCNFLINDSIVMWNTWCEKKNDSDEIAEEDYDEQTDTRFECGNNSMDLESQISTEMNCSVEYAEGVLRTLDPTSEHKLKGILRQCVFNGGLTLPVLHDLGHLDKGFKGKVSKEEFKKTFKTGIQNEDDMSLLIEKYADENGCSYMSFYYDLLAARMHELHGNVEGFIVTGKLLLNFTLAQMEYEIRHSYFDKDISTFGSKEKLRTAKTIVQTVLMGSKPVIWNLFPIKDKQLPEGYLNDVYKLVQQPRRVLFIGPCGVGKSATINTIVGKEVAKSESTLTENSVTESVEAFDVKNRRIILIDTPGFSFRDGVLDERIVRELENDQIINAVAFVFAIDRIKSDEYDFIKFGLTSGLQKNSFIILTKRNDLHNYSLDTFIYSQVNKRFCELYEQFDKRLIVFENSKSYAENIRSITQFECMVELLAFHPEESIKLSS